MGSATYLHDLVVDLLTAAESAIDPARTGNASLPPRRYVSWGEPAWDVCVGDVDTGSSGQLVAWWDEVTTDVSATGRMCAIRHVARLCVEVVRCVPSLEADGSPHPPAVYEAAAEVLSRDLWSLVTGLDEFWTSLGCESITVDEITPRGPDGGAAGARVCARVALNDRGPDPSIFGS